MKWFHLLKKTLLNNYKIDIYSIHKLYSNRFNTQCLSLMACTVNLPHTGETVQTKGKKKSKGSLASMVGMAL